ncbi:MAG TPA: hypothetical protein VFU33_03355 [Gaiellaceae bacterium]|nr:hypothetical protein [Gaiellaceae bacterium]
MDRRHGAVPLDLIAQGQPELLRLERIETVEAGAGHEEPGRVRADVDDSNSHLHRS